ncbi:hypothetical protein CYMTET_15176 [Cymbomonas tetramitiformis]|uniref:RING-type domain-containing protein n=1 Tax=Cymbomonas tetramitiformis TaxID=36881 RepID=A0AAE0GEK1_9CHLO|nr:hypothetical protein CYMTET_15176 [Cymbomonas tetramitiformis]
MTHDSLHSQSCESASTAPRLSRLELSASRGKRGSQRGHTTVMSTTAPADKELLLGEALRRKAGNAAPGPEPAPGSVQDVSRAQAAAEECSICLTPILRNQVTKRLPCGKNGHTFHLRCVNPWLSKHNTCPICRQPLHVNRMPPVQASARAASQVGQNIHYFADAFPAARPRPGAASSSARPTRPPSTRHDLLRAMRAAVEQ